MKKRSLISLLLVGVLAIAFVFGAMIIGTQAEETVMLYTVGDLGVEGATIVDSIQDALAALEEGSREWSATTTAEIQIQGNDHGGGAQDGVLFGQVTIWRENGTKLPITIRGIDESAARDAYIYLDSAGGWYACANDYTFINLTLPVAAQETYFYAGSGDVKIIDCSFNVVGEPTVRTVADRTAAYLNAKAAAEYIALDAANLITPDVGRLPCGDAWNKVRTSQDYYALGTTKTDANGDTYVDMDLTGKNGNAYGDYSHAGDTGGGQYLNACVYYEVLFGLECKNNPWRPTKYNLDETLVGILQKAAHDAVVEIYGESYFDKPQEMDIVGNDGVVNLLMVGSSSSYYMRDELHFMAAEIGVQLRIVHAYSSGIKMSTQWSWAQNGTSTWSVYTEWNKTTSGPQSLNFTQFVNKYPWDIIVTYQTGGSFNRKNLGDGYSDETVAKAISSCSKADEFINYMYSYNENANAGARYYWFQTVGGPIGAPGPNSDIKGYLYGDNCTSAVYAGWTEADIERYSENGKLSSSITLGEGTQYSGSKISAVGYMSTAPEKDFTDETAKNATFMEGTVPDGFTVPDVRPVNTQGKFIIDGSTVTTVGIHMGYSPASAVYHVKSGSNGSITTCSKNTTPRYGDVSILVTGGTIEQIDALRQGYLVGDLSFYMDDSDGNPVISVMLRMCFQSNSVSGDVTVDVRGGVVKGNVYSGGQAAGTVYNSFSDCTLAGDFFAVRSGTVNRVVNTFKNCTLEKNYYGGHYDSHTIGTVENYLDGVTIKGNYYGGSRTTGKISGGEVTIDGRKEEVSIYNKISGSTFEQTFYGGNGDDANVASTLWNDIGEGNTFVGRYYAGGTGYVKGPITNRIDGDSVFKDNFYGSTSSKNAGDVITEVSGDPIFEGTFSAMGYDASADDSEGKTLTTKISGGTFKSKAYLSGQMLRNRVSYVTVTGGTFNGNTYFGGYNSTAKEINSTIKGGIFNKPVYGGNCDAGEYVNAKKVNTVIEGGTFNASFYGASRGYVTGEVHTTVKGGTFNAAFYGGGYGKDAGEATSIGAITNEISGGVFNADYYGGSAYQTVESVTNNISGGTFENPTEKITKDDKTVTISLYAFYGGSKSGPITEGITNNITGGTFKRHAIFGSISTVGGDVTNNISGGTFELTSAGAGKGTISGSVYNNISGMANFKKGYYCGFSIKESSATVIEGNIINRVEQGPQSDRPYFGRAPAYNLSKDGSANSYYEVGNSDFGYMGGANSGTVNGYIQNTIEGGKFYGHTHGGHNGGSVNGVNEDGYSIVNYFKGGTYGYRVYGGTVSSPTLKGGVYNEISGGTYTYEFAAGHRAGTSSLTSTSFSDPIDTYIHGDPVFEKYICGVARGWNVEQSARVRVIAPMTLTIEGGTFKGNVYGICNNGEYGGKTASPGARIEEGGSVTVNINGGTFYGTILAGSQNYVADLYTGYSTVNIAPTKGDVAILGTAQSRFDKEIFTIGGGAYKLLIDGNSSIAASSYDGKLLVVEQTDTWTSGTTYLTLPTAENTSEVITTQKATVSGIAKKTVGETNTTWVGATGEAENVYGANLVLQSKVDLRVWLNKAEVDAVGADFRFAITRQGCDAALLSGTYADLQAKAEILTAKVDGVDTKFYTLVIPGASPSEYEMKYSISGTGMNLTELCMNDLLRIVIDDTAGQFTDGFKTLAKALWNYGIEAYNRFSGEISTLAKETLSAPTDAQIIASATDGTVSDAKLVGRALALREAVGLRIYLNLQNGVKVEDLTFTLDGIELDEELLNIRSENGNDYNTSVTLYITAKSMDQALNLTITKGEELVGSYTDSIASICQQYRDADGADADLCTALLRYIQAVPGMND